MGWWKKRRDRNGMEIQIERTIGRRPANCYLCTLAKCSVNTTGQLYSGKSGANRNGYAKINIMLINVMKMKFYGFILSEKSLVLRL